MTNISLSQFREAIIKATEPFLVNPENDNFEVLRIIVKENNFECVLFVSPVEELISVPLKTSATESYLALARELYVVLVENENRQETQFKTELVGACSEVSELCSCEHIRKVNSEYWEQHIFDVKVEVLKVKEKMEEHLYLLSEVRSLKQTRSSFREIIIQFCQENSLDVPEEFLVG